MPQQSKKKKEWPNNLNSDAGLINKIFTSSSSVIILEYVTWTIFLISEVNGDFQIIPAIYFPER